MTVGKFQYYDRVGGGNDSPKIVELPVADSQTLLVGDLVILSSNKVAIAGASSSTVLGVMAESITTGASAGGPLAKVALIEPGQRWRATADADASSAALGGKTYDINATTQTVDIGDTSNGCIFIWETMDSTTDVLISFSSTQWGY